MKLLLLLLAGVTIFAVGFVLVELRAPLTPSPANPPPASPPVATPSASPPVAAPSASPPVVPRAAAPPSLAAPSAAVTAPPQPPPRDPLDVVVRGKSRREWHAYYAQRQQQMVADIQRYQAIVDRAIAGEEPDPRDLSDAHVKIRELNTRLKEDLEALQLIDANP